MEENEKGVEFLESILDKEQEELSQSKRQHHTDWDNHILTLSTASLGFTFTFLPISMGCYSTLVYVGSLSFILAICFTTANYIVADKGFNLGFDSLIKKRIFNTELKHALFEVSKLTKEAERNNDQDTYDTAVNNYDKKVKKLFEEVDFDNEIKDRERINGRITKLNHAKTYSFIAGIVFIVIFSLINIDKFS